MGSGKWGSGTLLLATFVAGGCRVAGSTVVADEVQETVTGRGDAYIVH